MNADDRRIDHESAERMLKAASACPRSPAPESADPLVRLLQAAAAPGTEAELAGEEAAVAAFRARARGPRPARAAARHTPLLLASAALVITVLPVFLPAVLGMPSPGGRGEPPAGPPRIHAAPSQSATAPSVSADPSAAPSAAGTAAPETVRLCRAYTSAAKVNPQAARRSPAFAALSARTGGDVDRYCRLALKPSAPSGPAGKNNAGKDDGANRKGPENNPGRGKGKAESGKGAPGNGNAGNGSARSGKPGNGNPAGGNPGKQN
ncbi:hypothetical protein [Thermomonospora curvata]|uniref:RNA polymerase II n=1 Tax=Thermomonospora curvata (strain ATCC 19995 / DSM 43183 / JCM 3096 / KCTC 9072 / NBRC 15933 / NCIMB 10081 / Henssen B9) TaxID=471852 RepID=D1ABB5_THECD|nr:hypothetical protein [Thermomonospora curvata]ACY97151.1 RNA polymerase II [Thermomonospora curvata DSM 43183]